MLTPLGHCETMRHGFWFGSAALTLTALVAACGSSGDGTVPGAVGGSSSAGKGGGAKAGASGKAGSGTGGSSGGAGGSVGGTSAGGSSGEGGAAGDRPGAGGVEQCAATSQAAKLTPANLLFVIDKSGSMNCNPPEGDEALNALCADFPRKEDPSLPSKWEVASSALAGSLDTLAGQSNIRVGLTLFPQADECGVSADPAVSIAKLDAAQRGDMAEVLDDVAPSGETPIAGATILSYQHLSEAIRARELTGNTFVVLLTDGAETCKQSELPKLLTMDVPNARLFNIRTFVIGAPGSESARSLLSQIAWEGGTATSASCNHSDAEPDEGDCHFDMTTSEDFAADLDAALQKISRTKVLSCEFEVPENPDGGGVDRNKVNVSFKPGDGEVETIKLDNTAECADANGWQYSEDRSKIVLCGAVCDRVQADPEGEVKISLGCPTIKVT
jgi:hypothetical protein